MVLSFNVALESIESFDLVLLCWYGVLDVKGMSVTVTVVGVHTGGPLESNRD